MSNFRVIKKYGNRKLYDTKQNKYVTLKDLGIIIQASDDQVLVLDNHTKQDITSKVLLQILFNKEQELLVNNENAPKSILNVLRHTEGSLFTKKSVGENQ